ncbi:MarR family transcriptional regulator [Mobilitalea sibirica]|uniref:MarR family transcriptional regulator n=1 Tax=Mobilitalea sibirica TaxID=1462919 RepID=A0A8J7GZS6_9FIRM|nr:MarR family transcriptional regulator [Mobilitalea sibirica]
MESEANNLNLIELINLKYYKFKKMIEKECKNSYNIFITNSEWLVIYLIYGKQPTISEIAQQVNITRQATHKCIKALNSKGIITINNVVNNNKKKCLKLTPLGERLFLENNMFKEAVERDLAEQIGLENLNLLKSLLKKI